MKLGGRIQGAIDILQDLQKTKQPIGLALKNWGKQHRFAGVKDRSTIANIVYDALRQKKSTAHFMKNDSPRSLTFGTLLRQWKLDIETLNFACQQDKFAPPKLTDTEIKNIENKQRADDSTLADMPDWIIPLLQNNFGKNWLTQAQSFNTRPPLDVRVNLLKTNHDKTIKTFEKYQAQKTAIANFGIRIAPTIAEARHPSIQADAAFQKGWFEIQDEGSQIVSELICAKPQQQVLDFCAGGGGKTLALASFMKNKGQIHAYDYDKHRLKPIFQRTKRAACRNVQIYQTFENLKCLIGKMDKVVVDAPCSGSGIWRRRPDAKWKLTKQMLEQRINEQNNALLQAAPFVKKNGFLIYITCSILPPENEKQVKEFLHHHKNFQLIDLHKTWQEVFATKNIDNIKAHCNDSKTLTLTPASTQTDGFFIAKFICN